LSTFSKVALHAQWRGYGARSPVLSVSFWELFLCAYTVKEKVDKRQFASKVSDTNYRYQNFFIAFFFAIRGTKKKALQKRNADFFALTPRGRPLLKKWVKTISGGGANIPIKLTKTKETQNGTI
jgi:hypothetical protein